MKFVGKARGEGKTFELMEWLMKGDNRYVIVHSASEATRVRNLYFKKETPLARFRDRILPFQSARDRLRGINEPEVAIDNVDTLLQYAFGNVVQVTYTPKD